MTYREAKKLHNEDEVLSKETGRSLYVISVEVDTEHRDVFVRCSDGLCYHHTAIR